MERSTVTGRLPLPRGEGRQAEGFTLIELVMVITLLTILIGIAVPVYRTQVIMAKESALQHNLAVIRERIDQYKADKEKWPPSLQSLVEAGYFKDVPVDPMTKSNTWQEVMSEADPDRPDVEPGVQDVKSMSEEVGMNGRPYSEW